MDRPSIFSSKLIDTFEQWPAQPNNRLGQGGVAVLEHPDQPEDLSPSLRSNNSELGQMTPKRIDGLRALTTDRDDTTSARSSTTATPVHGMLLASS